MSAAGTKFIDLDQALDGARILYRHCMSTNPPSDGFVREFSKTAEFVRISPTSSIYDSGTWHRVAHLRVEDVLEPGRAPSYLPKGAKQS